MSESPSPNLSNKAVALEYTKNDELPRVTAKGAGYIAERIIALAKENDILITENTPLAETLSQLQVGVEIGSDTAEILVEALCFLYHIESEFDASDPNDPSSV